MTTTTTPTRDKQFYLDRFINALGSWTTPNPKVRHEYHAEIYKETAIVVWNRITTSPSGEETNNLQAFLWQVGTPYDTLNQLGWHYQGCITTMFGRSLTSLEVTLKKAYKKADFYEKLYSHKDELMKLARTNTPHVWHNSSPIFNARVNDVVRIRAFGKARLGKVISTTGSRFVVGYMTPSNNLEVHYKTLPLMYIYPKDEVAQP